MRTSTSPLLLKLSMTVLAGVALLTFPRFSLAINNLLFDTTAKSVAVNGVVKVPVQIHTDADVKVIGADVWLTYDPTFFDVQSADDGTFFSSIKPQMTTTGKIYIAGLFDDATSSKSGDGVIATLNLVAKKTGTTQIKYDCRGNTVSDTSKINVNISNPQNVIDCSSTVNNILTISVTDAASGGTTPSTTVTGAVTATPAAYAPATTTITQAPTTLPNSGAFDNTLYYALSGGVLVTVGGLMKKLFANPLS